MPLCVLSGAWQAWPWGGVPATSWGLSHMLENSRDLRFTGIRAWCGLIAPLSWARRMAAVAAGVNVLYSPGVPRVVVVLPNQGSVRLTVLKYRLVGKAQRGE